MKKIYLLSLTVSLAIGLGYVYLSNKSEYTRQVVQVSENKNTDFNQAVESSENTSMIDEKSILKNAPGLNPDALKVAVKGYKWSLNKGIIENPTILTIIDFSKPSNEKRLWVIDLKTNKVLMNIYTTQGKNSGLLYATSFSNTPSSDQTSLGVYKTLDVYEGKHGPSLRLQGLEKGINDKAYQRSIVIHPADYATPQYVKSNKRAGRSWGCFAIDPAVSNKLIDITKNGTVVFAYAPQEKNDPNIKNI
ncbi:murein L,D-transpeptidase catalytic domain family protein [Aquicella lusitana]|uniref:L,D-transpeptidase-like protein n=1 Tax=Aquicella lusitana TaxID=254246 RepID=A0A370GQW9_9COXI|nr:murein L,D-transpeptidase catalytic domain family protein [Aquicella lusitana]RDI46077.1 L,D-transpeptidase-like protein [Aquicella lusitana]VVC73326.1 hypothetical protein AQULUS_10610 [Aquicella lusitana]